MSDGDVLGATGVKMRIDAIENRFAARCILF